MGKRLTDKELVRLIARDDGHHRKPSYYRDAALHKFGRKISASTVTKAIGVWSSRTATGQNIVLAKAKDYLAACQHDSDYAAMILKKAALQWN